MNSQASDVTRIVLLVLLIGLLLAGSLWTLLPFLAGLIWATAIVIATWPMLLRLQRMVGGRRSPAAAIMTFIVLLAFVVPFAVAINTVVDAAGRSPAVLADFMADGLPAPPAWLGNVPGIGERLAGRWQELSDGGPQALVQAVRPYARSAAAWVVSATGGFAGMIVHALIVVILVAILYWNGETAARGTLALAHRLGGERGEQTTRLAGQAVRSVALGVVLTALVQSILAGFGLWLSGVPHSGLLTALVFTLGIAQLGPLPILAPAVIWLYWTGSAGWATVLLLWSIPVIALDNVLRPILIRRGVQLPMLLIIGGVIGGLLGFGVMGLFIGPVVLASTYTLTRAWVADALPAAAALSTPAPNVPPLTRDNETADEHGVRMTDQALPR